MSQKKRKSLVDAFVFRDAKEGVDRLEDSYRAEKKYQPSINQVSDKEQVESRSLSGKDLPVSAQHQPSIRFLWDDPDRVEIPAKAVGETRFLLISKTKKTYWSALFTYREKEIRIVSVRRSRKEEIEIYES